MNLNQLYEEARRIAVLEGLTDEDVVLQGLDPADPLDFVAGLGNHIFLFYSRLEPTKAKSWDKMSKNLRRWYIDSTDHLARMADEAETDQANKLGGESE